MILSDTEENGQPGGGGLPRVGVAAVQVAIIASGKDYQEAAAWAAATYARPAAVVEKVSVLVPRGEKTVSILREHAAAFGFSLRRFPFRAVSERKFTSQLKCQAFYFAVSQLEAEALLFLVDADTYCLKALRVGAADGRAILGGQVGLAPDIEDRHFRSRREPWYLAPWKRCPYVNSGVILTGRKGLGLFRRFRALSEQARFLHGPFNDQKVINYALGEYFRDKLWLLDRRYNGILQHLSSEAIIGHCAGGAGELGTQCRKEAHRAICEEILREGAGKGSGGGRPLRGGGGEAFLAAYASAVTKGLMGAQQYRRIAETIKATQPCTVLVIGAGHDSELWFQCAQGEVAFVEDDPRYVSLAPGPVVLYGFKSKVGRWGRVPAPPEAIAKGWDYVVVDGPRGYDEGCPGRQIPIAWASRLARQAVFVHDYERAWERLVCDRYLGKPAEIIADHNRKDRQLAVFRRLPGGGEGGGRGVRTNLDKRMTAVQQN